MCVCSVRLTVRGSSKRVFYSAWQWDRIKALYKMCIGEACVMKEAAWYHAGLVFPMPEALQGNHL